EKLEYDEAEIEDTYKKASFFFDILEMHAYKEAIVNKINQ
ncbi:transcriptional regulator, partial [Bacillus mobilis]